MPRTAAILFLALVFTGSASARQSASVSGFVRDAETRETLILANVLVQGTSSGAATNTSGYYVIDGLPAGTYRILASYLGYRSAVFDVTVAAGEARRLDIELEPEGLTAGEVVVEADRESVEERQRLGVARLTTAAIRQLPTVLEPDVFRSLQLLPGVKAASDFSSGLYVRGGSPDQTLILLDRTTVYNPSHLFGFFSTFNPDAIKDVRLFKGGFPAEYGGRIGSVVDVYNKDGNRRETRGRLSVGLLSSRAFLEGPYSRGSWMVAVRRSTLEPLFAGLRSADVDGIPNAFYFYDVNAKVNIDLGRGDKVSFSGYAGQDMLDASFLEGLDIGLTYGNRTFSADWTHLFSERLFSELTVTASRYASDADFSIARTEVGRNNSVYDLTVKGDLEYVHGEGHTVKGGFWVGMFTMRLANVFDARENFASRIHAPYGSAFVQQSWKASDRWNLGGGLRLSWFGEGNHVRLEPRASAEYVTPQGVRLQAAYGRYAQYLTLISSEVFSGLDTWLTTGRGVEPSYGDQFVLGVKSFLPGSIGFEWEAYYRTMRDLFQLDPFLLDPAGVDYDRLFHFGYGRAYGTELTLTRSFGRATGFVGYTLGATRRRFDAINEGAYYPPKYDRLHDLTAVVNYDLSSKWRMTTAFTYATGQAYTEPASQYRLVDFPFTAEEQPALVSPFNAARLPDYHRLDIGFTNRGRFFGFADYELQLQVINAYARRNVWFYFFDFDPDEAAGLVKRETVPQIPVPVPNIAFSLSF